MRVEKHSEVDIKLENNMEIRVMLAIAHLAEDKINEIIADRIEGEEKQGYVEGDLVVTPYVTVNKDVLEGIIKELMKTCS